MFLQLSRLSVIGMCLDFWLLNVYVWQLSMPKYGTCKLYTFPSTAQSLVWGRSSVWGRSNAIHTGRHVLDPSACTKQLCACVTARRGISDTCSWDVWMVHFNPLRSKVYAEVNGPTAGVNSVSLLIKGEDGGKEGRGGGGEEEEGYNK